jgi:hypothetical protein
MNKRSNRVLTCVYCGMEYPQDTPSWGDKILTEHIKVCTKHPMRKAENDIKILRKALIGLIGTETKKELTQMELALRQTIAPSADITASINAIHALLETQ